MQNKSILQKLYIVIENVKFNIDLNIKMASKPSYIITTYNSLHNSQIIELVF